MDGVGQAGRLQETGSSLFGPLRVTASEPRLFRYEFDSAQADDVVFARISTSPCTVRLAPRLISSGDPEVIKVVLQTAGRSGFEQDGRQCVLAPGDLSVFASDRAYAFALLEPYEVIVVGIPCGRFGGHADVLRRGPVVRRPTARGAGRVVAGFFRAMTDTLRGGDADFSAGAGRHLGDAVTSLVISEMVGGSFPVIEADPVDRILAYCTARLGDQSLSVASVARAHRMSVRYLHKRFQERELSLAAWIRRQRLDGIRRDLADPALAGRTVASIAARWGVSSAPHLSRAFKAEFGCTPADIRRRARLTS
jgi:AraC-like DNA-binding protein